MLDKVGNHITTFMSCDHTNILCEILVRKAKCIYIVNQCF